jgi:hypothetical protein
MWRIVLLLVLIILAGCLPDRDKVLFDCQKEADRFFQGDQADDPENPRSRYIIECMAAKDYDFTIEPRDCNERYPFPTQPACYVSDSWLDWIADQFRLAKIKK